MGQTFLFVSGGAVLAATSELAASRQTDRNVCPTKLAPSFISFALAQSHTHEDEGPILVVLGELHQLHEGFPALAESAILPSQGFIDQC